MLSEQEVKKIIPVAIPYLDKAEADAAAQTILSGWVTQGPQVAAFEKEFATYVGSQFACAVSNCTTALHLALLALDIKPNDEVITVSHSFIATANSIRYCGGIPVFIDIEPDTFNMNAELIESAITDKTKAILCVHQIGMPCDLKNILSIAKKYNLPVIEDAACAIGSEIKWEEKWERIGKSHADIACFSFHPRKVITTGDGGMLTTNNPAFDKKFRLWRQHAMSVSDKVRHQSKQVIFEEYPEVGFNYRLTDVQAAIGRKQLEKLPEIIKRRRGLASLYHTLLGEIPEVTAPYEPEYAKANWQSYAITLNDHFNQKVIMQLMLDEGIATRRGVMCSHREKSYQDFPQKHSLQHSEKAQEQVVLLPIYPQLFEEEIIHIVNILKKALTKHA